MPSVKEASRHGSQLASALSSGLQAIDRDERITFNQYQRIVLPLDGYVFWLRTGQSVTVPGSLHYSVDMRQAEDETIAINRIVFSSEQEVQEFNALGPNLIWIGQLGEAAASAEPPVPRPVSAADSPVLFAFSSRGLFFQQADVFHYVGVAVQPPMLAQLINSTADLPVEPIVTNSLPAWLTLQAYNPPWLAPLNPNITLYPSFAVPNNIPAPYGSVHISPSGTRAIQAIPSWDKNASHYQLAADSVRITLYGMNNNASDDFVDLVLQYSRDTDNFGIMNMPVVRDDKRAQTELATLAQKKTIDFEVSYIQTRINTLARQFIIAAPAAVLPQDLIASAPITYYPPPTFL